ncbi:hypothetical protein K435DRAFT_963274 [Dendrothele bispora CBS 962.96]|uniref:Uncharacterized protein n=1 Tax=Dendrothele bispora (strain CBS 962.96) TaxID=1314807 RepID=A0A4S8MJ90_DENBC|nr:hypothetical protein K435DRAFT_963274 [Dendrothele bispora CBS 962.96]
MFNILTRAFANLTGLNLNTIPHQNSPQSGNFYPSEDDVAVVRQDLLCFLPLELVDEILDYAEYWPRIFDCRRALIDIPGGRSCCYLVTQPVPGDSEPGENTGPVRHRSIREVKFQICSRDQGWGGENEHRGTYDGSWTWFETVILPPPAQFGHPSWYRDLLDGWPRLPPNVLQMLFGQDGQDRRWHIQSNVTASRKLREHTVTWTIDEENYGDQRYDQFKGRINCGHEVVRSLEAGDRLIIVARALFPGWVNHVDSASVEIFYFMR